MPYADSDYERSWKMQTKGVMLYPATLERLYAAAPDLLSVLRSIVEASQWEEPVAWLEAMWPQVNAALDKAEGKEVPNG